MVTKVNILIVEDEILIATDISNRLKDNNYNIIGIASSFNIAKKILEKNNTIDIVLIDIMLKNSLDGIELAKVINENYFIPFIFLTSHADKSIVDRAKKVNPHAYILKPFNDRQVSIAIELALTNFASNSPEKKPIKKQLENKVLKIKDSLFLKKNHHFERVSLKEILFLKADNNYCTVCTKTKRYIYSTVLKKIEAQLPINQFLRVHRSYVVNISSVNGFEGNMLFVGSEKIPVSKTYRNSVFSLFDTI